MQAFSKGSKYPIDTNLQSNLMSKFKTAILPIRKEQVLCQITSLVKEMGAISAKDIAVTLSPAISSRITNNYLDELVSYGHLNRIQLHGQRKNVRAFAFRSAYGTKADIVSTALSHPLHQISLRIAGKELQP